MNDVPRRLLSPAPKTAGVRASAWAAAVFTGFQALVLPLPLYRGPLGWVWSPATIATVALFAAVAWGAFRRTWLALGLLGALGAWRLVVLAAVGARLAMGRWEAEDVPSFLGVALTIPFAVLWIWGLASALHPHRLREARVASGQRSPLHLRPSV